MAVDTESRRTISRAIHSYLDNEIDNFRFDDILCECRTSDGLVNAIVETLWFFYDDCTRSHFRDNVKVANGRAPWLERWERLLQTDIDFDQPERKGVLITRPPRSGIWGKVNDLFYGLRPSFASNKFWPLSSADEWNQLGITFDDRRAHSTCPSH